LLTFVAAWAKVRRLAGRDPPVLLLVFNKVLQSNRFPICCSSLHSIETKLTFVSSLNGPSALDGPFFIIALRI
jgi:hypothetical protein